MLYNYSILHSKVITRLWLCSCSTIRMDQGANNTKVLGLTPIPIQLQSFTNTVTSDESFWWNVEKQPCFYESVSVWPYSNVALTKWAGQQESCQQILVQSNGNWARWIACLTVQRCYSAGTWQNTSGHTGCTHVLLALCPREVRFLLCPQAITGTGQSS